MTDVPHAAACLHSCSYGCGRTYDVMVVQVVDGSTMFLCMPCFMSFAHQIMTAMVEETNADVAEVTQNATFDNVTYVDPNAPGYTVRGHSDPTPEDDFAFDGMMEE